MLNLTTKAEHEILKAFDLIHSLGVIHGDIRAENILIADEAAWIIDFELAEIMEEGDEQKESKISEESAAVRELLNEFNRHSDLKNGSASC